LKQVNITRIGGTFLVNIEQIKDFIKENIKKYGYKGAVVGISGGIDSAVGGKLTVDALGSNKVLGLLMPDRDSAPTTLQDSKMMCNFLGIEYKVIKITGALRKMGVYKLQPPAELFPRKFQEKYVRNIWSSESDDPFLADLQNTGSERILKGQAYYRIKHRIRMLYLYLEAEQRQYAVIGCANKSEFLSGFYVKYGDDSSDIAPISHLHKSEVYEAARMLNIPQRIIDKPPSPDLMPGITDEFALGIKYMEFDRIVKKIEEGKDISDEPDKLVKRVKLIRDNSHYRRIKSLQL